MHFSKKQDTAFSRVGLDIGSHAIKGVETAQHGSETVIRALGSINLPKTDDTRDYANNTTIIQAIKSLWQQAEFRSKKVVLALPPEAVYLKWLHLEAEDEQTLDDVARTAAVRGAPFPAETAVTEYITLSSRGKVGNKVHFTMLIAVDGQWIDNMLMISESVGLEPLAVDIGSLASLRCVYRRSNDNSALWKGQPLAHCVIGSRNTILAVVRNFEVEFVRTIPVGGLDFTSIIAQELDISWNDAELIKVSPSTKLVEGGFLIGFHNEEHFRISCNAVIGRLAREIHRSIQFFCTQFSEGSYLGMIGAISSSGGGTLLKGISLCLKEHGIDISEVTNPFTGYRMDSLSDSTTDSAEILTQYSTAMGLAIGDYWSGAAKEIVSDAA